MKTRPKDIGTACETAVVKHLHTDGFPHAERRALAGAFDKGDIINTPGVCFEVKGGHVAEACSPGFLVEAQRQTLAEQINSGAEAHCLITKRKGVGNANAGQWWAWMRASQLMALLAGVLSTTDDAPDPWVRMTLTEACALFAYGGPGEAHDLSFLDAA